MRDSVGGSAWPASRGEESLSAGSQGWGGAWQGLFHLRLEYPEPWDWGFALLSQMVMNDLKLFLSLHFFSGKTTFFFHIPSPVTHTNIHKEKKKKKRHTQSSHEILLEASWSTHFQRENKCYERK